MIFLALSTVVLVMLQKSILNKRYDRLKILSNSLRSASHLPPNHPDTSVRSVQLLLITAKRKALSVEKVTELICLQIEKCSENHKNKNSFQNIYLKKCIIMTLLLTSVRAALTVSTQSGDYSFLVASLPDAVCQVGASIVLGYGCVFLFSKYPNDWFFNDELTPEGYEWIGALILSNLNQKNEFGIQLNEIHQQERRTGRSKNKERLQFLSMWATEKNISFKGKLQLYENVLPIVDLILFTSTIALVQGTFFTSIPTQLLR